ncbi:MAG: ATP-grasp domain-containing protein, partial [Pseudomonadota bacterium]
FAERAAELGLSVPETANAAAPEAAHLTKRFETVFKPIFTSSGKGLRYLKKGDAPPQDVSAIIQRKVEGRSVAATAICHAGRLIGAACYRPILEAGSVSIAFEREREAAPAITTWIETFIAAEALTGFVSFDFIVDDVGVPYAIECNPRATSAVHFFESKSLAAAILAPHKAQTVEAGGAERQQQFYACLTEFWARIRSRTERAAVARALRTCRDVTWRRDDPLPFLTMTPTSWEILRIAITQGVSLGEAATQDIGWFGEASGD